MDQVSHAASEQIPGSQTVALVRTLGGKVEFLEKYPVPIPGQNEVLAKVLFTGVCQSGKYSPKIHIPPKQETLD